MFCNKMLFKCMFWLHVVLMSLLLLIRTFARQGLFKKIEKMSFAVVHRVFCDCINIRFGCIFMRFMKRKLKNQNVSKNLVLVSL